MTDIPLILWRIEDSYASNKALLEALGKGTNLVKSENTKKISGQPEGTITLVSENDISSFKLYINVPSIPQLVDLHIDNLDNYEMNREAIIIRATDIDDPTISIKITLSGESTLTSWGLFTLVLRRLKSQKKCVKCWEEIAKIELDMEREVVSQ